MILRLGRSPGEGKERLPTPVFMGFPGGSTGKESACNVGDLGSIPGLGRSPVEGLGNPFQCSYLENPHEQRCLENPHEQRCLAGYSLWGCRVGHDQVHRNTYIHTHTHTHTHSHTQFAECFISHKFPRTLSHLIPPSVL